MSHKTNVNMCCSYQKPLLKFITDVYACKIYFPCIICLCNYYIILYYNGPPAWGLGEGLTTPHRKK